MSTLDLSPSALRRVAEYVRDEERGAHLARESTAPDDLRPYLAAPGLDRQLDQARRDIIVCLTYLPYAGHWRVCLWWDRELARREEFQSPKSGRSPVSVSVPSAPAYLVTSVCEPPPSHLAMVATQVSLFGRRAS